MERANFASASRPLEPDNLWVDSIFSSVVAVTLRDEHGGAKEMRAPCKNREREREKRRRVREHLNNQVGNAGHFGRIL